MSETKVIKLDRLRIAATPKRNSHVCSHKYVLVDEKTRMLECKACGQVIDPFIFVWEWASRDRNLEYTRAALKKDIDRLSKELAELKREEKNARSRMKRQKKQE